MKWTMFGVFCAACLLGLSVLFTTIPEEEHEEAAPAVDAPLNVEAATAIYEKSCLMCHGDQLQGGGGPALANVGSTMTLAEITKQIKNGGGGMPGYNSQLSASEISNLSKWLSEMK